MEWWSVEGQDTGSGVNKSGDHSRRRRQKGFYSTAAIFSTPKILTPTHRYENGAGRMEQSDRYNQIGPLDHKMADNSVSLARTNTLFSTITKPIKSWKTSNKGYRCNLLNRLNKMYTHNLFYLQQEWEAWLAPVYKQIQSLSLFTNRADRRRQTQLEPVSLWLTFSRLRHGPKCHPHSPKCHPCHCPSRCVLKWNSAVTVTSLILFS